MRALYRSSTLARLIKTDFQHTTLQRQLASCLLQAHIVQLYQLACPTEFFYRQPVVTAMNTSTPQNFDALVAQAQIAHRLVVGFYQRLLPTINQVAKELEFTLWEWDPSVTDRPCKKKLDPADHWAWDMVPMLASNFLYLRTNGATTEVGDAVLNMYVSFDSNFSSEEWEDEPDATQFPIGAATVEIYLTRCDKRSDKTLEQLWEEAGEMDDEETPGGWQPISQHLNTIFLKKSLANYIASPQDTIAQIRTLLDGTTT